MWCLVYLLLQSFFTRSEKHSASILQVKSSFRVVKTVWDFTEEKLTHCDELSPLTYTDFLNPFIAWSKYSIDLLHGCGIILEVVHFCEKGFFVEPGEHTAQETEGQLGAQRWSYWSTDWVWRMGLQLEVLALQRVWIAIAFSLTSVITLAMQRTFTVGKHGSNLPQMTMPSTIYQSTQYHSRPVKASVMMFTDLCSSDVCTTEEEAESPWRRWAGDRTVSGGVWAELLRCTSETVLPTVAWSSLSAVR